MRIVAGLEEASEGSVFLDGADITHTEPGDRDVAMVFQSYALYPHMNVYQNIAFPDAHGRHAQETKSTLP